MTKTEKEKCSADLFLVDRLVPHVEHAAHSLRVRTRASRFLQHGVDGS